MPAYFERESRLCTRPMYPGPFNKLRNEGCYHDVCPSYRFRMFGFALCLKPIHASALKIVR